jgi:hypothetical protein
VKPRLPEVPLSANVVHFERCDLPSATSESE